MGDTLVHSPLCFVFSFLVRLSVPGFRVDRAQSYTVPLVVAFLTSNVWIVLCDRYRYSSMVIPDAAADAGNFPTEVASFAVVVVVSLTMTMSNSTHVMAFQ